MSLSQMLEKLFALIEDRRANPQEGSYTNQLFAEGEDRIVQKVGEEAIEVVIAAKGQGKERLISELADLTYHTLVLMSHAGVTLEDVSAELERRHQPKK